MSPIRSLIMLIIMKFFQAYHGHHHAMEVLVQSLLDLDVRNSQGRTPLDLAAFKGHVECVDVLINQGASILVKDFTLKRTPIHAAGMDLCWILFNGLRIVFWTCYSEYADSICLLSLQLLMVIQNVCVCWLEMLIFKVQSTFKMGMDSKYNLFVVVSFLHTRVFKYLLTLYVLSLRTPLMLSVLSGHTDCVYSLLNKGASVEAKDKWGRTALHRGVRRFSFCICF